MRTYCSLLVLTCFLAWIAPAPLAQQAPAHDAPLPCTGNIEVVRLSDIKPGMMLKFFEAVALQQAWYKKMGTPDQIEIKRVVEYDSASKSYMISETQAVTSHLEPAMRNKELPHDADYDQFVALYKDSANIKSEYRTCGSH
jgi:hypothetical protein